MTVQIIIVSNMKVSILILLEIARRGNRKPCKFCSWGVSILILLEIARRESPQQPTRPTCACFNPYSTGNSPESKRKRRKALKDIQVSILILLEIARRDRPTNQNPKPPHSVSILILLEIARREHQQYILHRTLESFNPYSTGNSPESRGTLP